MARRLPASDAFEAARRADRPRAHTGSTETEIAILSATERLLERVPLAELSVGGILAESGISRATFYFYFSSKFAVVTSLLTQLYDDMFGLVAPYVERDENTPPHDALRQSLESAATLWRNHRAALRAVHEHWSNVPELRNAWLGIVDRFTEAVARRIDEDRRVGIAPPGPPSRPLAAALLWGADRCMYVAGLGADSDLASEQQAVDPLVAIWYGSIYNIQAPSSPKTNRRSQKAK
jgi:AcrR family transcriptional regulator